MLCAKSQITSRNLFSLLFCEEEVESGVLVLAKAFIDDSADGTRSKYVIAAAVMGKYSDWLQVERQWKTICKTPPTIKYFHSNEWRSLTGEFRQFTDKVKWPKPEGGIAANAKRDALMALLESKKRILAIAVAILIPEYERIRNSDPRAKIYFPEDAYDCALQSIIFESAKAIEGLGGNHQIGFVSDLSNKSAHYTKLFNDFKQTNPRVGQIMRGIAHLDDKRWPGLQAADLCAHIAKASFDKWDGRSLQEPLHELKPCFYKVCYWSDRYMRSVLASTARAQLAANAISLLPS